MSKSNTNSTSKAKAAEAVKVKVEASSQRAGTGRVSVPRAVKVAGLFFNKIRRERAAKVPATVSKTGAICRNLSEARTYSREAHALHQRNKHAGFAVLAGDR